MKIQLTAWDGYQRANVHLNKVQINILEYSWYRSWIFSIRNSKWNYPWLREFFNSWFPSNSLVVWGMYFCLFLSLFFLSPLRYVSSRRLGNSQNGKRRRVVSGTPSNESFPHFSWHPFLFDLLLFLLFLHSLSHIFALLPRVSQALTLNKYNIYQVFTFRYWFYFKFIGKVFHQFIKSFMQKENHNINCFAVDYREKNHNFFYVF